VLPTSQLIADARELPSRPTTAPARGYAYQDEGGIHNHKYYYNHQVDGEVTAQITSGVYGLKIQASLPKLVHGNNALDLDPMQTGGGMRQLVDLCQQAGVSFSADELQVSRLDLPKNAICKHSYQLYAPCIASINYRGGLSATYSNTYIRTGNKGKQVCFYEKDHHLNQLRLESRLLNSKAIKAASKKVGSITPASILDPDLLRAIYQHTVIDKINLKTFQKEFMQTPSVRLQFMYVLEIEMENRMTEKNRLAFDLMEIEGIDLPVKPLTSKEYIDATTRAALSIAPVNLLDVAREMTANHISQYYQGAGRRTKAYRMRQKFNQYEPTVITDPMRYEISQEFIEKFLTI
jgi:hypothetical protein